MAPRKMPRASKKNRLVIESQKSLTNFPQEVFNAWQNAGRFPKNFKNFDEMVAAYNASISGGMTPAEARDDLNIKFNAFKKQGNDYILDRRIIRTELDPWTEQLIDLSSGPKSGKLEAQRQRREFTFGEAATQAKAAERNIFMPRAVRAKIYYDKGHGRAAANALSPGSDDIENVLPEIAQINQLHKEKDRYPQWFMEEAGIPVSKPEAYFNRQIIEQGAPRRSGLSGPIAQPILDSLDRLIYDRAMYISKVTNKTPYDVWEIATDLDAFPHLNESYNIKSYGQALAAAEKAEQGKAITGEYPKWVNELAGTTSRGSTTGGPVKKNYSVAKAPNIDVSNVKISDATSGIGRVTRNPLMRGATAVSRAIPGPVDALLPGVIGGGLALAGGATLPQAAQAFGGGVAGGLSGDLEGAPEPSVQMVNVGGELRPLNTDTNTLMDKPGYGLEQSGGQWREVKRGTGVASQQQRQTIPQAQSRPRTAVAARTQGQMMPKTQPLNLANEGQYFIVNPIRSAFSSIFGKREI
jgi:hypothetical protein